MTRSYVLNVGPAASELDLIATTGSYVYTGTAASLTESTLPSGNNYISWDAESTTYSTYLGSDTINGFKSNSELSTDTSHSGTKSMKMTLIGNDGGNNSAGAEVDQLTLDIEWLDGVTLYYRWWMYIDADFSWGTGTAKSKSSRTGGVTCARGYTGYIRKTGFQIDECEDVGTPCGGGCPANGVTISYDFTQQSDSAWHEYIVSVLPNTGTATSNAVFKAWVDGDYIGQQTGFLLHNEDNNTMKEFWLGWMGSSYWQLNGTVDDGGVIYIDDVSVDDVWNSTTYEQGT